MLIKRRSERYLRDLGEQAFSSESALQRFLEPHLGPLFGLRLVSSSLAGGRRLGGIDTSAIDANGSPTILEFKRDEVSDKTMRQLKGYERWLLAHKRVFAKAVSARLKGRKVNWGKVHLVAVGYRYKHKLTSPSPSDSVIQILRYGYNTDKTVFIRQVHLRDARTFGKGRAPRFTKAPALERHRAKTTDAGREAFQLLRSQLKKRGFEERCPGKNRVRYWRSEHCRAEVTFTQVGLTVVFKSEDDIEDPLDRVKRSAKSDGKCTIGIVQPADVAYTIKLLGR